MWSDEQIDAAVNCVRDYLPTRDAEFHRGLARSVLKSAQFPHAYATLPFEPDYTDAETLTLRDRVRQVCGG